MGYWSSSLCCGIVLEPQWLAGLSALETPGAMPVGALSTGGATKATLQARQKMQQAGESKAESTRSPSWCMAGTEEVLTLQS